MTQLSILDVEPTARTLRDRVAAFLRAREGQWVDGMALAQIGGVYGWRTRISECRTQLGMRVENQQRKVGRRTVSEYRWVSE